MGNIILPESPNMSLKLGRLLTSLNTFVDERLVDVRNDTSSCNGSLDKRIQLFISADGKLQVSRCDTLDFKVFAGVSGQLEDFCREVFEDGRGVDSCSGSNSMSVVHSLL